MQDSTSWGGRLTSRCSGPQPPLPHTHPPKRRLASSELQRQALLDVLTSKRYIETMTDLRRATVYFEPDVHRALKLKAASTDRSISEMVNDAVRCALAEDAEDLDAFRERADEPDVDFEQFVLKLRRRGSL